MDSSADGLNLVAFLLATVLIGIASTLDAHERLAELSERARRFLPTDWRSVRPRSRRR